MENPDSWSPFTKAVAQAAKTFYRTVAVCDGPEPLDIKASVMAHALVQSGAVAAPNQARAREVILQALNDHRKSVESKMAGASMESTVSHALTDAALAAL